MSSVKLKVPNTRSLEASITHSGTAQLAGWELLTICRDVIDTQQDLLQSCSL